MLPTSPAPIGRAYSESRIATHDGYIWPFERARMVAPGAIRERMVEDIAALVHSGGEDAVVTVEDLGRIGWNSAQIEACGSAAFASYKDQAAPRRPRSHANSFHRMAAEAAALSIFLVPVLFWAGVLTGRI